MKAVFLIVLWTLVLKGAEVAVTQLPSWLGF